MDTWDVILPRAGICDLNGSICIVRVPYLCSPSLRRKLSQQRKAVREAFEGVASQYPDGLGGSRWVYDAVHVHETQTDGTKPFLGDLHLRIMCMSV